MTQLHVCRWFGIALLCSIAGDSAALAQAPPRGGSQQPPPSGRRIRANDGDTVVVEREARVIVVRRHEGNVRAVFDAGRHWLLLLADYGNPTSDAPDGIVDWVYTFRDVTGDWPLGPRWEGTSTVDEYSLAEGGSRALALFTPMGVLQLAAPHADFAAGDPAAAVTLTYRGSGRGQSSRMSFDEVEARQVQELTVHAGQTSMTTATGSGFGIEGSLSNPVAGVIVTLPGDRSRPPFVSGGNGQPTKLFDVRPLYPQKARDAGITGTVLVEITVGIDGAVTDAHVLRSIPSLDSAALDAVRQWRYEVTMRNGAPVPVILVVSVPFP